MPARRPSPILIKEETQPSKGGGIRGWLHRIFKRPEAVQKVQRIQQVLKEEAVSSPQPAETVEEDFGNRATVQLLPGRLEPLIPEVIQQEVRFQRDNVPGEQEFTLGWEMGEPPHHVSLDHPSIQPLHAKMTFQKGRWMIESLVPSDLVEVNGTPVPTTSGPYLLASGDQVRIGEALFRFHLP